MIELEETEKLSEEEQKYRQFIELCKRMFTRMESDNSWPWIEDPDGWNEAHPDHQITPEELGLTSEEPEQPKELRQESLF